MKLTKDQFKGTMIRNANMKVDLDDMKAHQQIIGDDTFKKKIKKEEKKNKVTDIEDIFDKSKKKKDKRSNNKKKKN